MNKKQTNPTMKRAITIGLLSFIVVAIVFAVMNEMQDSSSATPQTNSNSTETITNSVKSKEDRIVVYYFHGNARCFSCRIIEQYSDEAIRSAFKDELDSGFMEWHVVNVEKASNRHFIKQYNLYSQSLVASAVKDNKEIKSKLLEKTWEYLRNKERFVNYVQSEIKELIPLVRK